MDARRRPLPLVVIVAFLLGAVACSSSGPPPHGRFTRARLDAIVLGPSDAPSGTTYVDSASGFDEVQAFARDARELRFLQRDGFEVGHVALFFPSDHVNTSGGTSPLTNDSVIVQGIAGLFHDADGAERSLERYLGDLRNRQIPGAKDIPSDGLGDRAFGLQGTTPDGAHLLVYLWRVDNLILVVSGAGPILSTEVRGLADLVDGRAA